MFGKKNKIKISKDIERLYTFYLNNIDLIDTYLKEELKQSDKRTLIKKIYDLLNYSILPKKEYTENEPNDAINVYRGISAPNAETLEKYVNEFISGELYFGSRASIFGTGIYTCCDNNIDEARKYASDGNTNTCGAIVESKLKNDAKIISYYDIVNYQNEILEQFKKMSANKMFQKYIELLYNPGLFSALLGYDAIYVEEKKYIVVLNRGKLA